MNNIRSIFYYLFTICLILYLPSKGIAQTGKYHKACKENTIEAYEVYLTKYPKSKYSYSIRSRLQYLEYNNVIESHDFNAYQEFLTKYPNSTIGKKLEIEFQQNEFSRIKEKNTVAGYNEFLNKYPKSLFRDEVYWLKVAIKSEDETSRIEKTDSISNMEDVDIIVYSCINNLTKVSAKDIYNKIPISVLAKGLQQRYISRIADLGLIQFADGYETKNLREEIFIKEHNKIGTYLEFFGKVTDEDPNYAGDINAWLLYFQSSESNLLRSAKKSGSSTISVYLESFLTNETEKYFSNPN